MMPKWQKLQKGNPCKMRYHNITKDDMLNGEVFPTVMIKSQNGEFFDYKSKYEENGATPAWW